MIPINIIAYSLGRMIPQDNINIRDERTKHFYVHIILNYFNNFLFAFTKDRAGLTYCGASLGAPRPPPPIAPSPDKYTVHQHHSL